MDEVTQLIKLVLTEDSFGSLTQSEEEEVLNGPNNTETATSFFVEHYFHLMEGDLNAVTAILVSTTSLADRVETVRSRFLKSGSQEVLEFQVDGLEGTVNQLPSSIAKACECLGRINDRASQLRQQYRECTEPFKRCVIIQERFRVLETSIDTAIAKVVKGEEVPIIVVTVFCKFL